MNTDQSNILDNQESPIFYTNQFTESASQTNAIIPPPIVNNVQSSVISEPSQGYNEQIINQMFSSNNDLEYSPQPPMIQPAQQPPMMQPAQQPPMIQPAQQPPMIQQIQPNAQDGNTLMSNALFALAAGDTISSREYAQKASLAFETEGSITSAVVALTLAEHPERFAA